MRPVPRLLRLRIQDERVEKTRQRLTEPAVEMTAGKLGVDLASGRHGLRFYGRERGP